MDKKNKNLNVPNLRFDGYFSEWRKFSVSELLETFPTNSLSWSQLSYTPNKLKNIHYGLIHNGFKTTCISTENDLIPFIKNDNHLNKYTILKTGDLILADASEDRKDVGKSIEIIDKTKQQVVSGLHTIHARDKSEFIVLGFKGFYFQSIAMKKQIYKIANGSKIFGISSSNFKELYMCLPSESEQKKIVSLMMSIENRIDTQIKIIDDLNIQIKLLLDAFFNNIDDYDVYKLNELGSIYNGLSGKSKVDFGYGSAFIPYTNIYNNNVVDTNLLQYVRIDENENQNKVLKGDILFTASSETPYEVGIASIYLSDLNPIYLNSFSLGFRLNSNIVNNKYLCYLFQSKYFRKIIFKYSQGSTRYNLNRESLLNHKIKFHKRDEQDKIVKLLDEINSKIKNESHILKKYEIQKTYLLNNLFI